MKKLLLFFVILLFSVNAYASNIGCEYYNSTILKCWNNGTIENTTYYDLIGYQFANAINRFSWANYDFGIEYLGREYSINRTDLDFNWNTDNSTYYLLNWSKLIGVGSRQVYLEYSYKQLLNDDLVNMTLKAVTVSGFTIRNEIGLYTKMKDINLGGNPLLLLNNNTQYSLRLPPENYTDLTNSVSIYDYPNNIIWYFDKVPQRVETLNVTQPYNTVKIVNYYNFTKNNEIYQYSRFWIDANISVNQITATSLSLIGSGVSVYNFSFVYTVTNQWYPGLFINTHTTLSSISELGGEYISAVYWNNTPATYLVGTSVYDVNGLHSYYIIPTYKGTSNITVEYSSLSSEGVVNYYMTIGTYSLYNVNQTDPIGSYNFSTATSNKVSNNLVGKSNKNFLFDVVGILTGSTAVTATKNVTEMIQAYNQLLGIVTYRLRVLSAYNTSSASKRWFNWTLSTTKSWNSIMIEVNHIDTKPLISLIPVDNYITTNGTVTILCNSSDVINLTNISIYTNTTGVWSINSSAYNSYYIAGTNTYSINKSITFNVPIGSNYTFGCLAYNNDTAFNYSGNRSFSYIPVSEETKKDNILDLLKKRKDYNYFVVYITLFILVLLTFLLSDL